MSEDLDDIVDNLKEPSAWIRIVFMLAFAVVLYLIIAPVILVLMITQALFSVITGETNRNLNYLGEVLSKYVYQILEFITYGTETKPFPFSDFPNSDDSTAGNDSKGGIDKIEEELDVEVQKKPAAKKKAAKKKSTSKKKDVESADE